MCREMSVTSPAAKSRKSVASEGQVHEMSIVPPSYGRVGVVTVFLNSLLELTVGAVFRLCCDTKLGMDIRTAPYTFPFLFMAMYSPVPAECIATTPTFTEET